jgi:hypothetical protein
LFHWYLKIEVYKMKILGTQPGRKTKLSVAEKKAIAAAEAAGIKPEPKKPSKTGRKIGSSNVVTQVARLAAQASGLLPHEWLLAVARGEGIEQKRWKITVDRKGEETKELITEVIYPDFHMRQDSAKAAAPYYAPRLAAQTVDLTGTLGVTRMSDSELDDELRRLVGGGAASTSGTDQE